MAIKDTLRAMNESNNPKFLATNEEQALAANNNEGNSMFEYQRSFLLENINEA